MFDNFDDNNSKNYDNTHNSINLETSIIYSPDSNIIKDDSSSFHFNITGPSLITKFFIELLQELNIYFLNMSNISHNSLSEIIKNYLWEYDLDPKNVLEIMTSTSQNIFYYSSLIGYFYQRGIGCKVNEAKTLEIFSNAFKYIQKTGSNQFLLNNKNEAIIFCNNDIKKLNEMILLYFYSLFFYEDLILNSMDNYKLHIRNAEKGDPISQYYIGNYYFGIGTGCDYNKAIEWYSKSSKGGNFRAMYALGYCYEYGRGVNKYEEKAFEFYLKSAEGGNKHALSRLGNLYCYGIGVSGILKDESKAFEWYLKAAEKGDVFSQYKVANFYYDGKYIPKDEEKSFYWCRKAAINDNIEAQFKLAEYYLDNPINKNESKAFKWYLKLANRNKQRAIYLVAKCYRDGIGIDKNLTEASNWIKKYIKSNFYGKTPITILNFLNGKDIDVSQLSRS
ncbi:hypothetical protein C1645_836295 [Glomus cerebriforme]|uniref:HCP-like protein n=1 Tax=Glomus cerebriforme TaxID=658196 RepID=A0A397SCW1_9GLOM|nr:hypothetical protein C1645_836295 [Glomus cerebriforme]